MAEKKEVELEFTADTSKLKKAMREAKQFTGEMQTSSQNMNKSTLKGTKDIAKISKKTSKLKDKHGGRSAIRDEKKLQREKKQTTTEVLKQSKAYQDIQKDAGKLQNNISSITSKTRGLNRELRRTKNLFGGGGGGGRGGGGPGGGGGRRGGVAGFLGGFLKKGALGLGKMALGGLAAIPGTLLGIITSQLTGGYQERMAYGQAYGGLAGTGGKLSTLQNLRGTKSQIMNQHEYSYLEKLGFGPIEAAQQAAPVARATGQIGATRTALGMQRATTMGGGEVAQFMGLLTQAGVGFGGSGGKGGKKELQKIIAHGMASGLERARLPEFFSGVTALTQKMMAATAGKVSPGPYSELLATLGSSGQPGLQGFRGAAAAQILDRGIRSPGGGEAGRAFMLQAGGFGKPGGDASYYEAIKMFEKGATKENVGRIIAEAKRQYGGSLERRALAMKKLLPGMTATLWEGIEKAWNNQDEEKIEKYLNKTKPVDQQALEEMKEFGDTTKHMADLQNRSIGIGTAIEDSVKKLESLINEFVIKALPLAVKALESIVTTLNDIWLWLNNTLPALVSDDPSDIHKSHVKSYKEFKKVQKKFRSGDLSREKYDEALKKFSGRMQGLHGDLTPSGVDDFIESGNQLYADVGRTLGFKSKDDETVQEWRERKRKLLMKTKSGADRERHALALRENMGFAGLDIDRQLLHGQTAALAKGSRTEPELFKKFISAMDREKNELMNEGDTKISDETLKLINQLIEAEKASTNAAENLSRITRKGNPADTTKPNTTGGTQ